MKKINELIKLRDSYISGMLSSELVQSKLSVLFLDNCNSTEQEKAAKKLDNDLELIIFTLLPEKQLDATKNVINEAIAYLAKMNIKTIEQAIQSAINNCDKVIITAGPEFNCKNRKMNRVLASIETREDIQMLSTLLVLEWNEDDQGWLDNYARAHINFLRQRELIYSIGIANRAVIMVSEIDDALSVIEYERLGEWLEAQDVTPRMLH